MKITSHILKALRQGKPVGAELTAPRPDFRAFILVIPQTTDAKENFNITSYEIRYLEHHSKYTDKEWGMDYDYVLGDTTTRIKRIFVTREDEIEPVLAQWLKDLSAITEPDDFDSSLVNSPIDLYLNRPDECPHLWL